MVHHLELNASSRGAQKMVISGVIFCTLLGTCRIGTANACFGEWSRIHSPIVQQVSQARASDNQVHYISVSLASNWFALVGVGSHWFALVCIDLHWFALVCIGLHWFALVCIGLYWFALVCVGLRWFALVCIGLHTVRLK